MYRKGSLMKYLLLPFLTITNLAYADYCDDYYNNYKSDWDKKNLLHHCQQANKGDPESQFSLASWLKTDAKKPNEAYKWLIASAKSGCGKSQLGVGYLLFSGDGVEQDLSEAYKYFSLAASSGIPLAQYLQGYMLFYGYGINKDLNRGMNLIKNSAMQVTSQAYSQLGYIYQEGIGVERNLGISGQYFIQANVADALNSLKGNKFDCDIYKN